jgi:hypothetical protein
MPNTDSDIWWMILKHFLLTDIVMIYHIIFIYTYHLIVHWIKYSDPKNEFKISDCGTLEEASIAHFTVLLQQNPWRNREESVG